MSLQKFDSLELQPGFLELLGALKIFERSEDGQKRRNLKVLIRARKKAYKLFKKDGVLDDYEKDLLILADEAIIKAMQKLAQ